MIDIIHSFAATGEKDLSLRGTALCILTVIALLLLPLETVHAHGGWGDPLGMNLLFVSALVWGAGALLWIIMFFVINFRKEYNIAKLKNFLLWLMLFIFCTIMEYYMLFVSAQMLKNQGEDFTMRVFIVPGILMSLPYPLAWIFCLKHFRNDADPRLIRKALLAICLAATFFIGLFFLLILIS